VIAVQLLAMTLSCGGVERSSNNGGGGAGGTMEVMPGPGASPSPGEEHQPCYGNGTCNQPFICLSQVCVRPPEIEGGPIGSGGAAGGPPADGGGGAALDGGNGVSGGAADANEAGPSMPPCTSNTETNPALPIASYCAILAATCKGGDLKVAYGSEASCTMVYDVSTKKQCQSYHLCLAARATTPATVTLHCGHAQGNAPCAP
jgi:hypothetical protein